MYGVWFLGLSGDNFLDKHRFRYGRTPIAIVPNLNIVPDKRILVIGTYGLGVWYINLP